MRARVFRNEDAVANAGSAFLAKAAREAVAARGQFLMAVSGGRTPGKMFRALAQEDVPWYGVHIVQVDERVAPAGHVDRNLTHLRENLLSGVPLRPDRIHAMPVEKLDPFAAAAYYAQVLEGLAGENPVLDVVHLGLGTDGHTASLVPGDRTLFKSNADVAFSRVYQERQRMTLTYRLLNRARQILWLVAGREKAQMLARLCAGDETIPAGLVRRDRAVILADEGAASLLRLKSLAEGWFEIRLDPA